ncbi:MAG: hypothetical protein LBG90_06830 [Spirochaetaceae bacterium]|jgi:hypothetical protein|nr:hypothetical protein [Spirochaetaceae bacterium]
MIFDFFGSKKKTSEDIEQEKEAERAWALYGSEVEAYLENTKQNQAFRDLEKSKAVSRPKLRIRMMQEEQEPLTIDLMLRVKRGEIQESKARRFMQDPELAKLLAAPSWRR